MTRRRFRTRVPLATSRRKARFIPDIGKYVLPLSLIVIGVAVIVQVSRR